MKLCELYVANIFCIIRFGSLIVGAIRSKLSAKGKKNGGKKDSMRKKGQRGSFSFQGGMQVFFWVVFIPHKNTLFL